MKKQLLFLLISIWNFQTFSQVIFENGYFLNNSDQKVDCLIKNLGWKNNPNHFEYKSSESDQVKKYSIDSIKEFGIYHASKYIRKKVKIDISNEKMNDLTYNRNPILEEKELFLKVLVEGKSDLYFYRNGGLEKYFFSKDSSNVEPLIFRTYKISNTRIVKNLTFRQQLWNNLNCGISSIEDLEKIDYRKNDLVSYFVDYNICSDSGFINFDHQRKKDLFHLTLRPGINNSSLRIQNLTDNSRDNDFENELGLRLGLELEFIAPFNRNKWAVIIEPTYQYFKSENKGPSQNVTVDYRSIELPIGIRHYLFINEKSKIFINGLAYSDLSFDSVIDFETEPDLAIRALGNLAFGIGYNRMNKYSLELRYHTSRNVLLNYFYWRSDYRTVSFIIGYSIF